MAVTHLSDAFVRVNSVDLSDHVKSVDFTYEAEALDDTLMGDDTRSNLAGLKNWSCSITFAQDYAASEVDATLFSLVGAAAFPLRVRPDNSAGASATNQNINGQAILTSYPPISGAVGDFHETTVTFASAGTLSQSSTGT
jgi:hypothetical protein